ncbi:MAG: hypothetical protein OEW58_10740, partial [Gammaproteobacteria bacterium]|nr:hypothetical protein [Gammaproteobacteria bacterium]
NQGSGIMLKFCRKGSTLFFHGTPRSGWQFYHLKWCPVLLDHYIKTQYASRLYRSVPSKPYDNKYTRQTMMRHDLDYPPSNASASIPGKFTVFSAPTKKKPRSFLQGFLI